MERNDNKQVQEAYIVCALRTAVGKRNGIFAQERPDNLLATMLKTILTQNPNLDPVAIDDVIIGCAMPEAEQGLNIARIALLLAGYPNSVSGMTVNRFCASGVQSIALAAERIALGRADIMVAGGVESMSMIPMTGNKPAFNPEIFKHDNIAIAFGMGITAEKVAHQYDISRERQDEYAFNSHQRACDAIKKSWFQEEIVSCDVIQTKFDPKTQSVVEQEIQAGQDECPRFDTSMQALSNLKPVFANDGSVTAGNSSQMSDGAGAVLLVSEHALKTFNLQPIAHFIDFTVAGVEPAIMGIGPVKAIPKLLERQKINLLDISWIELNEAFAAQTLAVIDELALDIEIVNPVGGAIALGHPLGATGAIRSATLLHGLRKRKQRYGMVTMCIGTGMGAACLFENIL